MKKTITRRPSLKEFEKSSGIRFNVNMTGKMEGIRCLSTSNLCNPLCAARKNNPDMICSRCYADTSCKRFKALGVNMARNSEILSTRLFEVEEFPLLPDRIFRLEAFGDIINATHARNYLRFAHSNPETMFALWTKNPWFIRDAIAEGETKPDNLVILLSSPFIGVRADASSWEFVDKTFTVYRKSEMSEEAINCGSRQCLSCLRCYKHNGERDIREYLK